MLVSVELKIPMVLMAVGSCVVLEAGVKVMFMGGREVSGASVVVHTVMSAGKKGERSMSKSKLLMQDIKCRDNTVGGWVQVYHFFLSKNMRNPKFSPSHKLWFVVSFQTNHNFLVQAASIGLRDYFGCHVAVSNCQCIYWFVPFSFAKDKACITLSFLSYCKISMFVLMKHVL